MIEETKSGLHSKLKNIQDTEKQATAELCELDDAEDRIMEQELTVMRLYEVAKKMSEGLRFEDIFNIFSVFLKENFVFRRNELLVLKEIDKALHIDRIYKVWAEGENSSGESAVDYDGIIKLVSERKKEVCIARSTDEEIFDSLRIEKEVLTFIAVPLLSERQIVGILIVENLPHIDLDRFIILSAQFALEIKKVLLYETVEALAITDGLTGLYVRRYFFERVDEELKRSRRYKFKFSFLMIDIDDFKKCNDAHGHLVGDVILRDVGRIIKENSREIDLAARYGGEEFALILPEAGGEQARIAAERLRRKIEESVFKAYDEKLKTTISVGIAVYPDDSSDVKELVKKADKALYLAKAGGKNIVYEYKK